MKSIKEMNSRELFCLLTVRAVLSGYVSVGTVRCNVL